MKLSKSQDHPLRIYLIEETQGEIAVLIRALNNKYSAPESEYSSNNEDELDSLILFDEYKKLHYIVHGLLNIIIREATLVGISCNNEIPISDLSVECPEIDKGILEGINLRSYQSEGISYCLGHKRGIIQVHTGGGKTEMMIGVARYLLDHSDMNILICVPTVTLLYQTYDRMIKRGIQDSDISLLGDGNIIDATRRITVSTVQSAFKRLDMYEDYMDWLSKVDCLMMDEAHHSKCRTWSTLIDRVAPEYLLGFSAEPFHRDKDHMISDLILRGLLGPVIHRVTMDYLVDHGYLSKPYVIAVDTKCKGSLYSVVDWTTVNKNCLVGNTLRNELIRDIASLLISENKNPLILVQQIKHGQDLARLISLMGYNVYMMTGGKRVSVYVNGQDIDDYVDNDNMLFKDFNDGKVDALIGTSTLDEGVDIPSLASVILAGGGKGRLKSIQRIGRALRQKEGLNISFIIDFRDRFNVITKSQFNKRKALYDESGMSTYFTGDSIPQVKELMKSIEYSRGLELGLINNENQA